MRTIVALEEQGVVGTPGPALGEALRRGLAARRPVTLEVGGAERVAGVVAGVDSEPSGLVDQLGMDCRTGVVVGEPGRSRLPEQLGCGC